MTNPPGPGPDPYPQQPYQAYGPPPVPLRAGQFPPPFSGYGPPPLPPIPPKKSQTGLWVAVGLVVVVVIALGVTGFVAPGFFLSKNTSVATTSTSTTPVTPSAASVPSTPAAPPSAASVTIPTVRTPTPHRATPLANPVNCQYPADTQTPAPKHATAPADGRLSSTGTVVVTLRTSAGDIPLALDRALAPCTVNSFLGLAQQSFYTGTSCHRLGTSSLQMLQCGDPAGNGSGGPGYSYADEVFPELAYGRGILAMANAGPDTNGSQFFLVYGDAPLPPSYTVFGTISDQGLQVLDKVARGGIDPAAAESSQDGTGKPAIPVTFSGVTVGG
ncbi:MAG: ppiB [Amycolatopsis sp.]|uniref:peptidylprolyl isomerase n=1 Tax=Amycolatopsis sp. TaxID=37632 RepID=UPI0026169540|nr:peptidylprolyl isomerase [Amycolatopsis sp.]MCU1679353.1 ppiB [Amycolatopsis sp.]